MQFLTVCTAQIDLKGCLYGILYDRIHIRGLEDVEMGELGGWVWPSGRGKHSISHD